MKITAHPVRKGTGEGPWVAQHLRPGNTAYLIMGEQSLARLAEIMGDTAMAARRRKRIERASRPCAEGVRRRRLAPSFSVRRDSLEKIPVATIGSWIPLAAGVPTRDQAERMAEALASPAWRTPAAGHLATTDRAGNPTPSGAAMSGRHRLSIASGLAAYGHRDIAADIADSGTGQRHPERHTSERCDYSVHRRKLWSRPTTA